MTFVPLHIVDLQFQKEIFFSPTQNIPIWGRKFSRNMFFSEKLNHNYCELQVHPVNFSWREHRVDSQNQGKQLNLLCCSLVTLSVSSHCLYLVILAKISDIEVFWRVIPWLLTLHRGKIYQEGYQVTAEELRGLGPLRFVKLNPPSVLGTSY